MTATITPTRPVESADVQAFRAGLVKFTWTDVVRMCEAGILYEDASAELLNGELVYRDCGGDSGVGGDHERPGGKVVAPPADVRSAVDAYRAGVVRFTVDEATRMVQVGILPEDASVELLDGVLVRRECGAANGDPYVEGDDHNFAVAALAAFAPLVAAAADCHLRTQSLLVLTDSYSPYPDGLVLRGPVSAYRGRRPSAADAVCVIEVADSSYPRDAGPKRLAYAAAGVPQYVIIDLRRRRAEVYADPAEGDYPPPAVVAADGVLPVAVGDGRTVAVPLADVLP